MSAGKRKCLCSKFFIKNVRVAAGWNIMQSSKNFFFFSPSLSVIFCPLTSPLRSSAVCLLNVPKVSAKKMRDWTFFFFLHCLSWGCEMACYTLSEGQVNTTVKKKPTIRWILLITALLLFIHLRVFSNDRTRWISVSQNTSQNTLLHSVYLLFTYCLNRRVFIRF